MKKFDKISTILVLFYEIEIGTKCSGNSDSILKADRILAIPGLGEFCGFCFKNHNLKEG